ncbi:MAG: pgcA [Bacillales bacterium]|jgi:phosphoglucomutase|nr:pgcA [Bacillales bacterium]
MSWKQQFNKWNNFKQLDTKLKEQLASFSNDESKLVEAFYKNLEFGTGGMRGEMGPGTSRMNIYTIRKATQGLAEYVANQGEDAKSRGVVIAYDSRNNSKEFAIEAAKTLASNNVKAFLFSELRPTPVLSYAVRFLNAYAGIMITASHNPPEYNGFKAYGPDGGQFPPFESEELLNYVNAITSELEIKVDSYENLSNLGLIEEVCSEVEDTYIDALEAVLLEQSPREVKIVFTPLHGTGQTVLNRAFEKYGFVNFKCVKEQCEADGNFPTINTPNPEEEVAFTYARKVGESFNADLLIATDPDADRVGICVKNSDGEYIKLSGNQTGALLTYFLLAQKAESGELLTNGTIINTVVTSEFADSIAKSFGVGVEKTLTGFKFISEKIKQYETSNDGKVFLFGFEESYGYLIKDFARDKDAIQASLLISEMADFYKKQDLTLLDVLEILYTRFGFYKEALESITLKGMDGLEKIDVLMTNFRNNKLYEIGGKRVIAIEDYKKSENTNVIEGTTTTLNFPKSNVIKFLLEDDAWVCVRPSGTEPKIKFYYGVKEVNHEASNALLVSLSKSVKNIVNAVV